MSRRVVAAVDVGASAGRVIAGVIDDGRIALDPIHRFDNAVIARDGHLRWDVARLLAEVMAGLGALAARYPDVESIGIDTWAVDYALLDENGALLDDPISYRDQRTADAVAFVHAQIPPDELYRINGLHSLPFNTLYQFVADARAGRSERAAHAALLPDLIAHQLTGVLRSEYTNATTTGLVDLTTHDWSSELANRLGIRTSLLGPIEQPGSTRGRVTSDVAARLGVRPSTVVTTVGSHDTASAVVGVPAAGEGFAFAASGTWSLVGVEVAAAVTTEPARAA